MENFPKPSMTCVINKKCVARKNIDCQHVANKFLMQFDLALTINSAWINMDS